MCTVPTEVLPISKFVKNEYDNAGATHDDAKKHMSKVVEILYPTLEQIGVTNALKQMMVYILDNNKGPSDPADTPLYEERVKQAVEQFLCFLMENSQERMEVMFFFKSCYLTLDLELAGLSKTLHALAMAASKASEIERQSTTA